MNSRQANRHPAHRSSNSNAMSDGPSRSPARPASPSASRSSFAQDFNLEHSDSAACTAPAVSAQPGSSQTGAQSARKFHDSASPNCIYLG